MLEQFSRWLFTRKSTQAVLRPLLLRLAAKPTYCRGGREGEQNYAFVGRRLFKIFGYTVNLHKIMRADTVGEFHSHPYNAFRLILSGGYTEEVLTSRKRTHRLLVATTRTHKRSLYEGHYGKVLTSDVHRLDSLIAHCHAFGFHEDLKRRIDGSTTDAELTEPVFSLWIHGPRLCETQFYFTEETP